VQEQLVHYFSTNKKLAFWHESDLEELASLSSALPGPMDFRRPCYRLLWPWGRLWLRSSSSHFFIWAS
jgi:hypothetical protein